MTACMKTATERQKATCLPLDEARRRIWQAAHDAIGIIHSAKPFCPQKPFEIITKFMRTDYADAAERSGRVDRIGPREVRKLTCNALELFPG
jgi:D-aminopeptidase